MYWVCNGTPRQEAEPDSTQQSQIQKSLPTEQRIHGCRHDFVVVETIDFFDDEDAELPPPMTQRDVVLLNRAGAFEEEEAAKAATGEAGKGQEDMEVSHALSVNRFTA